MKLEIYGSGCTKCKLLAEHAEKAARDLGVDYTIEKVTDMNAIIDAGVLRTPALAINGSVVVEGAVPSAEKIKGFIC
ncbi:MAG: TM0996/MTH895 family glutaredoxin-like protein [Gammaproteobacteria bacterium]|nr:TM0996/MTH895 family glutaredoxin-like protein [Gammaproteobacteria bacterium]NNL50724.1 thioredoxin family protein [Woeseiaceae bacterium]